MNILDLLLGVLLLLSALFGLFAGFLRMFFYLVSWGVALLVCMKYMSLVMPLVREQLSAQSSLAPAISFLATFVPAFLVCILISHLLRRLVKMQSEVLDRVLGLGLGCALGLLLSITVLFLAGFGRAPLEASRLWQQSLLAPPLQQVVRWTSARLLPAGMGGGWRTFRGPATPNGPSFGDFSDASPEEQVQQWQSETAPDDSGAYSSEEQVRWLPERTPGAWQAPDGPPPESEWDDHEPPQGGGR